MSLSELLQNTLNPANQKAATSALLNAVEIQSNTLLLLCELTTSQDKVVSHTAAVFLKNAIIRHYHNTDYMNVESRSLLKQKLLDLLAHPQLNKIVKQQISVSIASVADTDSWLELPQILGANLMHSNLETQLLLLETIYMYVSVWKKYDLGANIIRDIQTSTDTFFIPYLLPFIDSEFNNFPKNLQVEQYDLKFDLFLNISKIAFTFIFHDIPEQLEPHLQALVDVFSFFLVWNDPLYKSHEQNLIHESTRLTILRGSILDFIQVLFSKYLEDISSYSNKIISNVWGLILEYSYTVEESLDQTTLVTSTRDVMISKALSNIKTCVLANIGLDILVGNGNQESVDYMVNKVIVGNILVRREDLELFEDEPLVYAVREIEGNEALSINKSTSDLVKASITKSPLSASIVASCLRFVDQFLKHFNSNDPNSWKYKSTATRLICCVCIDANEHAIILNDFLTNQILPCLDPSTTPVLLADAIYFVVHFKKLFKQHELINIVGKLVDILQFQVNKPNDVVCTFSCNAIERILALNLLNSSDIQMGTLFNAIFTILDKKEGIYLSENEYYLKVLIRAILVLNKQVGQYANSLLEHLFVYMNRVALNPVNPKFNHYLFECIGMVLKYTLNDPNNIQMVDQQLVPIFINILDQDISEYSPYIFQILSVLLLGDVKHALTANSKVYTILPILIKPHLWVPNNTPSLTKLLNAFMSNNQLIFTESLIFGVLGVFQNLVSSKRYAIHGMKLLTGMYHTKILLNVTKYTREVFNVLLVRLQNYKIFGIEFTQLMCYLMSHDQYGPLYVIEGIEGIQQG